MSRLGAPLQRRVPGAARAMLNSSTGGAGRGSSNSGRGSGGESSSSAAASSKMKMVDASEVEGLNRASAERQKNVNDKTSIGAERSVLKVSFVQFIMIIKLR